MLNPNTASAEQREALPRMEYMRDALIGATYAPDRAIDPNIVALNLVHPDIDLLERINILRAAMLGDPRRRERAVSFWVANHRLILPRDPNDITVGSEYTVAARVPPAETFIRYTKDAVTSFESEFAVSPHTHYMHVAFSPSDLVPLFLNSPHTDMGNVGTAAWVITPEGTGVVFRGPGTPGLNPEDCAQQRREWGKQIAQVAAAQVHPGTAEYDSARRAAQDAWFNQVMNQCDLQFFAGGVGDSVLLKQPEWR